MGLKLTSEIRFEFYEGAEKVLVTLRRPTPEELNRFLKDRFVTVRNQVRNNLPEARRALIDKILVDVEGLTADNAAGEEVRVNRALVLSEGDRVHFSAMLGFPVESWKDLIPTSWKNSWALRFEESRDEGDVAVP